MKCTHVIRSFLFVITLMFVTLTLGACGSLQETIAQATNLRNDASHARDTVATQIESLEETKASLPIDSTAHADAASALAIANTKLAALDAAVLHADRVLAEMTDPQDSLTQGVGAISPFLPAPVQGPALLGAALIATLLRAHQVRKCAGSIAASIQKAMADPDFKQAFERQAGTIRSIQTPAARRIVDQETGSRPGLKMPI